MSSVLVLSSLVAAAAPPAAPAQTWSFHLDHVLGTSFDMAVATPSQSEARFAFAAATTEIGRLERVLSGWRDDSELSALNRTSQIQASPDLFAVLSACERWRARTGGAFSARLGHVEQAWAGAADARPDAQALCAAAARAEAAEVGLDPASRTVVRPEAVRFAPDGLAKGYVIDAALAVARRAAPCATGILVDIGGDVACWGAASWRVGVADPAQLADNAAPAAVVALANQALAVSGPGMRDRRIGAEAFSHLLDPRTGQPARRVQAAVIAPTATEADALATALAVMPADAAIALAERRPGVEALLIEGGRQRATSGWQSACQAASALPAGFAVEVSYEIPKVAAPNYRKPYVLVWVTDADKNLVSTLLVQGTKAEYQQDNYVWWRRYGRKQPGLLDAIGKPTRPPGRYTVGWDGTDDSGKRAPQGRYIVHVEAAREHGGHTYQAVEINLGAAPASAAQPGKDELGTAQVRYGKAK
jgi:thiamine biosynthesis lipoprotein